MKAVQGMAGSWSSMPPNGVAEAFRGEWGISMSAIDEPQQDQTAQETNQETNDVPHGHPRILALAKHLDGHAPVELFVVRHVNHAQAAFAEFALEAEAG